MSALEPPPEPAAPARPTPWYLRRGVLLGAAVVVILVLAVLSDLPTPQSRSSNVAGADAFMKEVNTDLQPCDYALAEAYRFRGDQLRGTLTTFDRGELPQLLQDDQVACSLADPSISDLTTGIESPGTQVQDQLGQMMAAATEWVTPDALRAIEAIQALSTDPTDATAERALVHYTATLARVRRQARGEISDADRVLAAQLYQVSLPPVSLPRS